MRSVRLPKDLLLLVSQSALPEVQCASQGTMARTACRGATAGGVLSCSFHRTPTAGTAGTAEPAPGVWHALPCRRRNPVANRRQPQAPGRPARLFGGAAYLGTKPAFSSPSPLCRARRRPRARPELLDCMSPAVPVAGQGAQPSLPG